MKNMLNLLGNGKYSLLLYKILISFASFRNVVYWSINQYATRLRNCQAKAYFLWLKIAKWTV